MLFVYISYSYLTPILKQEFTKVRLNVFLLSQALPPPITITPCWEVEGTTYCNTRTALPFVDSTPSAPRGRNQEHGGT